MSRLSANALSVDSVITIDFKGMAAAQEKDSELLKLNSSPSSLILKDMPLPMSDSIILCNVSTTAPHFYVPGSHHCIVFDSLSRPGIEWHSVWSLLDSFGRALVPMSEGGLGHIQSVSD